jgi:signal transduction histidine kinase
MQDQAGAIHLLDSEEDELILSAQRDLSNAMLKSTRTLDLKEQFWKKLVYSENPVVISNISGSSFPYQIYEENTTNPYHAYIGTPIRTKGRPLGTLSIFTRSIEDYTVDDLTFLTTIADQVGLAIERTRLVKKAEQAAIMDERQRLARELHDSVTQLLYSQVLFAGAGLREYEQKKLPLVERHLNSIDQTAQQALKEMRLLVYELQPVDYLDQGFEKALRRRLDAVEKRLGIEVDFSVEGKPDLDEESEIELYRIAEEALNNTLKHANATRVSVSLQSAQGQVKLEVTDNGCGFSLEGSSSNGGMGLINMQQRAKFLHGSMRIITRPGWGTRIRVII